MAWFDVALNLFARRTGTSTPEQVDKTADAQNALHVADLTARTTLTSLLGQLDITLSALRDALRGLAGKSLSDIWQTLQAQREMSESLWTDDAGGYYMRRIVMDESATPPTFTVTWTDKDGNASAGPGTGARPVSSLDRELVEARYIATAPGTGYAAGEYLARVLIVDASQSPPVVDAAIWANLTTGATIGTPTPGTYEESTEVVGLKNVAGAQINPATYDTQLLRYNAFATLLDMLAAGTTEKTVRLEDHGANSQFSYNVRAPIATAVDAAAHEVLRQRRIGPATSITAATYARSGATVTVTTPASQPHSFETGDLAYHTGATDTGLNGYAKVTVTGANTYTFQTGASGAASGSITVKPMGSEFRYRSGVALTALESGW